MTNAVIETILSRTAAKYYDPAATLTVRNGVLYFADIASPRTILNLKRTPAAGERHNEANMAVIDR
jgi:hypothetical protein